MTSISRGSIAGLVACLTGLATSASAQSISSSADPWSSVAGAVATVDLAVTKAVDDPAPNEGDTIAYLVLLTNAGPDVATNVELTDMLPAGVTYASHTTTQGSYAAGSGVWGPLTVAPGQADTLAITATVDTGSGGSVIVNIATITAVDPTDVNPSNDSDSADIIVQSVDLGVVKAVDDPTPSEGATIEYTIALGNSGLNTATSIEVTDVLPDGVTFVSSAATQGSYASGTGIWSMASLAPAASETLTITATVDSGTLGTTIVNGASVTAVDQADAYPGNDADSTSITIPAADLSLTKAVDDAGPPEGGTVDYTVVLANAGPDGVTAVEVTDALPGGVTFLSSVATRGSYSSGTGVWSVPGLFAGAADTLMITATVDPGTGGTTIVNAASVTASDLPDPNPGNESDSAAVTVEGADLGVVKTIDDPLPPEGGTITYTVVLTNDGPDPATDVQIDDLLPAGVTYVSSAVTQGFYISGTGVWILASIPPASADTLTITATVDPGTTGSTIVNTATITASDQDDGNPANDVASASLTVPGADLGIAKTVDVPAPNEGDTIQYSVVLSNAGPDSAGNVEVTDALPAGVTYVSSSTSQGSYASGSGAWSVAGIAAGASDTLTVTATVGAGTAGTTIVNAASVTARRTRR